MENNDGQKRESSLELESGEVNPSSTGAISSPNKALTTTALGRPMRKSASKFSAMKLLKAGIAFADDEGSNEDADWHPTVTHTNDTSDDYVPPETVSFHVSSCICFPLVDSSIRFASINICGLVFIKLPLLALNNNAFQVLGCFLYPVPLRLVSRQLGSAQNEPLMYALQTN